MNIMKKENKNSIINAIIVILLICLVALCVFASFNRSSFFNRWLPTILLFLLVPLLIVSYIAYRNYFYNNEKTAYSTAFFIPKMYGIGITINPNHPLGKIIWILLILFIAGMAIYSIVQ